MADEKDGSDIQVITKKFSEINPTVLNQIVEIFKETWEDYGEAVGKELLNIYNGLSARDNAKHVTYVSIRTPDGERIGGGVTWGTVERNGKKYLVLGFFAVSPEYRGRGFGKKLAKEIERMGKELGVSYVLATIDDYTALYRMKEDVATRKKNCIDVVNRVDDYDEISPEGFYRKMGYKKAEDLIVYVDKNEPAPRALVYLPINGKEAPDREEIKDMFSAFLYASYTPEERQKLKDIFKLSYLRSPEACEPVLD